jgi:hypothetical protein
MPYKNKNKQNEYSKNKMREYRQRKKKVIPVEPQVIPVEPNPFIYDIMRFELLYDTIRMRELLLRKTRFNIWMNYQLNVLEELELLFKRKTYI